MKKKTSLKKQSKKLQRSVGPAASVHCKESTSETDIYELATTANTEPKQKPSKKEKKLNKKSFAIATLRRASYRWPPREQCRREAKVARNQYRCAACPSNKLFGRKDTQIDHIEPVIKIESGWQSFDSFIDRLFCDTPQGFQLLCKEHHKIKTEQEKELRKFHRRMKKDDV